MHDATPRRPPLRPRWWPENEPWPPPGGPNREAWRRMGVRMVWRAVFGVGCFMMIAVALGTLAFWVIALAAGWVDGPREMIFPRLGPIWFVAPGLFMAVLIAVAARIVRRAIRPAHDLLNAVGKLEAGDFTARASVRGPREVRALAAAFNAMAARLQHDELTRRNLLADITHELRTPLTILQGTLEGMADGVYPADPARLDVLLDETRVMSRLIDDLRTLSLAESGQLRLQLEETDLAALAGDVAASYAGQAAAAGVALEAGADAGMPVVMADPVRIREVLSNLVANALRYTPAGGRVSVRTGAAPAQDGPRAWVEVRDTGAGIAPADLGRVFDRFYRSRDSGGSGLGLAIAKQLVEAHGGVIDVESELGRGTAMRVLFPAPVR